MMTVKIVVSCKVTNLNLQDAKKVHAIAMDMGLGVNIDDKILTISFNHREIKAGEPITIPAGKEWLWKEIEKLTNFSI